VRHRWNVAIVSAYTRGIALSFLARRADLIPNSNQTTVIFPLRLAAAANRLISWELRDKARPDAPLSASADREKENDGFNGQFEKALFCSRNRFFIPGNFFMFQSG